MSAKTTIVKGVDATPSLIVSNVKGSSYDSVTGASGTPTVKGAFVANVQHDAERGIYYLSLIDQYGKHNRSFQVLPSTSVVNVIPGLTLPLSGSLNHGDVINISYDEFYNVNTQ